MRKCAECGVHRFPEEVAAHGICAPCVRKRQLVGRVVIPRSPRVGRVGHRVTLEEVARRIRERDDRLRAYNAARMREVAARLPQQRSSALDGAPNKHEAARTGIPTASTTTTLCGGSSGCVCHGKA